MSIRIRLILTAALTAAPALASAQSGTLEFIINGRPVSLPLETPIIVDDRAGTLADLLYLPDGLQARWSDVVASAPHGAAATPVFSYSIIGPVTATQPFAVLGQPTTITGDTVLAGVTLPVALPIGTPVVVAGLVDVNGSVLATLVERRGAFGNRFLLTGAVEAVGAQAGTFRVGDQWVEASGVAFVDCAAAFPAVGEFVELRADAVTPFPPGTTLTTVTNGRCVAPVPAGTPGAAGFLEGLISAVPAADRFQIGALSIMHDTATQFTFGSVDDLGEGAAVVVDGTYVDALTFDADVIEFVRPVVRFEAPLVPADVVPNVSLRPFGVVVRHSAQVRDEDGILATGLTQPTQVEVRGYLDRDGQAFATRVRERGDPDPADVRLRGPVEAIGDPLLTIQGLTVDTTGATFVDEYDTPMTRAEFFAAVAVDHLVDVSGAAWNPATSTLTGGIVVWIGAEPLRPAQPVHAAGLTGVVAGTATGYALPDSIHADGFEQ